MALLEQLQDEFISTLFWSDKATDDQKQLVTGNIKAFTQFLAGRIGNATSVRVLPSITSEVLEVARDGVSMPIESTEKVGENGYQEYTSPEVASIAARGIRYPASLTFTDIRAVCASALTQAGGNPVPPKPQG